MQLCKSTLLLMALVAISMGGLVRAMPTMDTGAGGDMPAEMDTVPSDPAVLEEGLVVVAAAEEDDSLGGGAAPVDDAAALPDSSTLADPAAVTDAAPVDAAAPGALAGTKTVSTANSTSVNATATEPSGTLGSIGGFLAGFFDNVVADTRWLVGATTCEDEEKFLKDATEALEQAKKEQPMDTDKVKAAQLKVTETQAKRDRVCQEEHVQKVKEAEAAAAEAAAAAANLNSTNTTDVNVSLAAGSEPAAATSEALPSATTTPAGTEEVPASTDIAGMEGMSPSFDAPMPEEPTAGSMEALPMDESMSGGIALEEGPALPAGEMGPETM